MSAKWKSLAFTLIGLMPGTVCAEQTYGEIECVRSERVVLDLVERDNKAKKVGTYPAKDLALPAKVVTNRSKGTLGYPAENPQYWFVARDFVMKKLEYAGPSGTKLESAPASGAQLGGAAKNPCN